MIKLLLLIALNIALIYARTVKFSVIAFGTNVQVKIGSTKYTMTKTNSYDPVFTYTAGNLSSSSYSYKYIVDNKEESFTRTLSSTATTTHNEFFERKDTIKTLPEFNHPDKGTWKKSIGKTSLFDDSYIPTVHIYGTNAEKTFTEATSSYVSRVTFILKDDIIVLKNVACYPKNVSWPKFQFKLIGNQYAGDTSGVYNRYVLKFRDNNEDPTFFRQKLYSDIMDTIGVPTIQTIFARVYVNNKPVGLYVLQEEAASESFARACFHGDNNGKLKITNINKLGHPLDCSTGADIAYGDGVSYSAFQPYNKTRYDNSRIKLLAKALYDLDINNETAVSNFDKQWFDINSFLKAVAMEYLTGHWDSYLFYSTNYAMYDNPDESDESNKRYKFYFICQDWDNTFGINLDDSYIHCAVDEFLNYSYKNYVNAKWGVDSYDAPRRYVFDKLLSNKNIKKKFENILTDIVKYIMNPTSFEPRLSAFVERFKDEVKFSYTTTPWRTGTEKIKWDMGDFERNLNYKGRHGVEFGLREFVCKRAKGINSEFSLGLKIDCSAYESPKECGPGYGYCHDNKCCSPYGWCGTTTAHCGTGCQSGYGLCTNTNGKCGPNNGNAKCPSGQCCSSKGYCGTTSAYCGTGCQSEFGTCSTSTSTSTKCGPNNGNAKCPSGQCCSSKGYCGTTSAYCGTGCQSEFGTCSTSTSTSTKCGPNNGNAKCPSGQCCSSKGYCGTTSAYCGTGCQANFGTCSSVISTNGKCGPKNGNTVCPSDQCCSSKGYCGTTKAYCGTGCQASFGKCYPTSTNSKCGAKNGNTVCPSGQCCSSKGYCGTTSAYCGTGCQANFGTCSASTSTSTKCGPNNGNAKCPSGQCCSSKGYCGTTVAYCGAGCQSGFGTCYAASTNGYCGAKNGNTVCPTGECCSTFGYCGKSTDFCVTYCQSGFGAC
ncbi:hypothetical protein BCR36DRAFT_408328 [Piromyces finnis]|uniref:Chitin-binding type-1 domain-containing protein n=1 Tax=Piromyces finnis TaxID=1754191 RepID=A0A1Y1VM20_9FUNG|nr:hypothetical protein BCR36DRAFT_408328 [Piromyces finnis]|eukprot:ORX59958.1 hypothetical protein BCR36DRAFT_408328 [Piromyces finnis]